MNKLNNYFMKPTYLKDLAIYPIKLMEYENFKLLASQYLLLDIPQLNNKRKQEGLPKLEQDNLFDYLVYLMEESKSKINEMNRQIKIIKSLPKEVKEKQTEENPELQVFIENLETIEKIYSKSIEDQLCELISMTVKKDVSFINGIYKAFVIYDMDEENRVKKIKWVINKDNFYDYRKIVMEQNCLFTPLVAPSKKAQKYIDAKFNKGVKLEIDLEAMVAFVTTNTNHDYYEDTYYRLMADFRTLNKQMNRNDIIEFTSGGMTKKGGGQLEIPNIFESLGLDKSPWDEIFKEDHGNEKRY